jgi:hypothetical protein
MVCVNLIPGLGSLRRPLEAPRKACSALLGPTTTFFNLRRTRELQYLSQNY